MIDRDVLALALIAARPEVPWPSDVNWIASVPLLTPATHRCVRPTAPRRWGGTRNDQTLRPDCW